MRNDSTVYVGLDVHKESITVAYAVDAGWCRTYYQVPRAELDPVSMAQIAVRAFGAARTRYRNPATRAAIQHPCTGHVIGVDVGVDCVKQTKSRLCPFLIMCMTSMPIRMTRAQSKSLNPSIGLVRRLMARWSCSTTLFKYLT
jgi:hypothetical protein